MQIIWYIHIIRFLAFFTSLITFICHLSQCILLDAYQDQSGISDWITAGHWQYLLWYISLSLSLAGSFTLCLNAYYYNKPRRYVLDKCIGLLAIIPVLSSIITAMSLNSLEPWTDGLIIFERSSNHLLSSCTVFDSSLDKLYPLLYQRCILNDLTWIFSILICIAWTSLIILANIAYSQKKKETAKNIIQPAQEPHWGRYIPDPPASIYSSTTLGNMPGLLTPSFIKQYNYTNRSVPSLPSTIIDCYKEEKKSYDYDNYRSRSSRDYPPSISSSTFHTLPTKLTLDFEYQYSHTATSSPMTPSSSEPERDISSTPLYNSFASKSKKTRCTLRD